MRFTLEGKDSFYKRIIKDKIDNHLNLDQKFNNFFFIFLISIY